MYGYALLYREMTIVQQIEFDIKLAELRMSQQIENDMIKFITSDLHRTETHILSDGSVIDIFSESQGEYQNKERLVKCENCKYEIKTSIPGPKCGICHSYLIVVLR